MVGDPVEVAVGIGPTVVVLILLGEDPIRVDPHGIVDQSHHVAVAQIGITVAIVVILHQLPVEGLVVDPEYVRVGQVRVEIQIGAQLGCEPGFEGEVLAADAPAPEPSGGVQIVRRTALRKPGGYR